MNESLGFKGCSFLCPGTVQRAAIAKQRRRRNVGSAPYEAIRGSFIEKRKTYTESIDYRSVRRVLLASTSSEPAFKQDSEGPSSRKSEISDIERVWP